MRPVMHMTSTAGTLPAPSLRGRRRWEMIPRSEPGQHDPHLLLLEEREEVDDPVDRLGHVDGVQRAHDEVTGLGRGQRGPHRLLVAHLADQDDVGSCRRTYLSADA